MTRHSSSSSFIRAFSSPPVLSLIFARIFYAVNWFNISSIFYLIVIDFKQDISMLGLITASFLVGIGLFQVVAGILAAKYSPMKIAICGILIASVASLFSGLAIELSQMMILRFIVGIGMAFFFGPSVILISDYLGKGSEGLGVALLNSAQASGAIIGIFGWVLIAQTVGWRISLVISGILGIVSGLFLVFTLARGEEKMKDKGRQQQQQQFHSSYGTIKLSDLRQTLLNKSLIILGLALLGIQIGWNVISTFTVFYLKDHLHISPTIAGLVGSLSLVSILVFSPVFGGIYTKIKNSKNLLLLCGVALSISISIIALNTFYAAIISIILAGFFAAGGFIIPYAKAKEINEKYQPMYQTLAVSFVNGVSLFGAFWVPLLFSSIARHSGYSMAWILGSLLTLVLVLPLVRQKL
ncbi:MAG TPA: MFS transporter [Methylomirabilota bacterium]|nr:MFS transporter [Methylomirabilota bacterium]